MALPKLRFWEYDDSEKITAKTFSACDAGAYEPSAEPWWRIKIWNDKGDEQGSDKATSIKMTVRDTDGGVSELWTIQHWIEIKSDGAVGIADATITAEADVDFESDKLTITIDIPTREEIKFTTTDTLPDPLVVGTLYYTIRVDATHIKVATTLANADAGAAINLTDEGVGTHTITVYIKDDAMPGFQSVGLNKELSLGDIPKGCYRVLYIRCHPPTDAIENPTVAFVLRVTHQEPSSSICNWITGLRGNGVVASTGNPFAMSTTGATDPIPYQGGCYALINNNEIYYGSSGTYDISTTGSGTYKIYLSESGAFNETTGSVAANELSLYEATISSGTCTALIDKRVYLAGIQSGTTGAMPSNPNLGDVYIGTNGRMYVAKTAGTYTEQIISATQVEVSEIGTATYDDIQDFINNTQSGGRISGGTIADDSSGGITISSGTGIIKTTTGDIGLTQSFDWVAGTIVSTGLTDNSANYIYMDSNAGTPQILATADRTSIRLQDQFTMGRLYKSGTDLHILNSGVRMYNFSRREHERLVAVRGFERASGGVISESAVTERAIESTVGNFYLGLNKVITEVQNTSTGGDDYFTTHYHSSTGAWTYSTGQTQIDNTQYDTSTTGLTTLTANRYGVHWVYIHFEDDLHVVFGQGDYTLAGAEAAILPTSLPSVVEDFGILASKIIIQEDSTGFNSIVTAYEQLFPVGDPIDHNDLGGLQGGTGNEYYHFTSAEHSEITEWAGAVTLSTGGAINLVEFSTSGTVNIPSGQEYQINGAEVKLDEWATPTTGTTLNATTGLHGLLLKLGGGTVDYLRADGTWAVPTGSTEGEANTASNAGTTGIGIYYQKAGVDLEFKAIRGGSSKITATDTTGTHTVSIDVNSTGILLDSLGTPSTGTTLNSSTGRHGLLPKLTGSTSTYLAANGTWAAPPGSTEGEANTASNVGTGGEVFKQKDGVDLEFRKIEAGSNQIDISWYTEGAYNEEQSQITGTNQYVGDLIPPKQRALLFIASSTYNIKKIAIYVRKIGTPVADMTVGLYAVDGDHHPIGSSLASGTISQSDVTTDYAYVDCIFSMLYEVVSGTEYAIVFEGPGTSASHSFRVSSYDVNGHKYLNNDTGEPADWNTNVDEALRYKLYSIGLTYFDQIEIDVNEGNIKLDDLGAPDNNTDLNATTGHHGLLLKGDANTTHYLAGDLSWTSTTGIVLDSLATPSTGTALNATTGVHGLIPIRSGNAATWFDGSGVWTAPTASEVGALYSSGAFTVRAIPEIASTGGVLSASPFTVTTGDVFNFGAHSVGFTEQAIATTTGTASINWSNGIKALFTRSTGANGAVTFSFTAPPKSVDLQLIIRGSTAGSTGTITWPTVYWQGASAPSLSSGVSAIDKIGLYYSTGLSGYLGESLINYSTV